MITIYHVRNAIVALGVFSALGFVVVLFSAKVLPERAKEREAAFLSRDPVQAAQADYRKGDLQFVRVWKWTYAGRDRTGAWEVAGKDEIDRRWLHLYPGRRDLWITANPGLMPEYDALKRDAQIFAYAYNLAAAEILRNEEEEFSIK